jgi:hypothetical protein
MNLGLSKSKEEGAQEEREKNMVVLKQTVK